MPPSPRTDSVTRMPDHPGRVELDELHVDEGAACPHRQGLAVTGVLPRVAGHLERLADATGRDDDRRRVEDHESAGLPPVAERPGDGALATCPVEQQVGDRQLGEHLQPGLRVTELALVLLLKRDDALLQRADQLEPGAVTDVRQPRVLVATEVALADPPVGCPVEEGAPCFQLPDPLRGLFCVHVAHGCGDPALGHHRVGLAEQRLADHRGALALSPGLDGCPQAGTAGPDHDDVVRVPLDFGHKRAAPRRR